LDKRIINKYVKTKEEVFFFNEEDFLIGQTCGEKLSMSLLDEDPIFSQAFITFFIKDGVALSPCRAPFGSLELKSTITEGELLYFVNHLIDYFKKEGIEKIEIVSYPECYSPHKSLFIHQVLLSAGFKVTVTELNYHLEVDETPFADKIHLSEKRRLKKALQAGFTSEVSTHCDYGSMHRLISECRSRKGYPLSMQSEEFEKMFVQYPGRYLAFCIKDHGKLIATAVGVKVHSELLYNFLPADDIDYKNFSPMIMLTELMYQYCLANNMKLLDLGIGTYKGIRNEGLIKFKEHTGGILSHKYTYGINVEC
jgi:hypothetical protein